MCDNDTEDRRKLGHLFQFGKCIYCGTPIDVIPGVQFWRGGHILPKEMPICEAALKAVEGGER